MYAQQIASAKREWETGNTESAWHYLDWCRWDFGGWEHDYLYTLLNKNQTTLLHAGKMQCMALSPDGSTIASGSYDKTIRLWDRASGQETATLKGHTGYLHGVNSVAFSPDGRQIASGSEDHTIKVWEVGTSLP